MMTPAHEGLGAYLIGWFSERGPVPWPGLLTCGGLWDVPPMWSAWGWAPAANEALDHASLHTIQDIE